MICGILFLGVALLTVGCEKGPKRPKDLPKLVPLTLTVTQNGAPCAQAKVRLVHAEQKSSYPWNITGMTDATGVWKVMVNGNWNGCPEGDFLVCVEKLEVVSNAKDPGAAPEKITRTVNEKYSSPTKTDLKINVSRGVMEQKVDVGPAVNENVPVAG